jgi:hypothetical protein
MSARRWADYLLPDAFSMQLGWLLELVRGDENLLAQIARSSTARRLLARRAYAQHRITVPARAALAPHQQWLLADHMQQLALARRLGLVAAQEFIRTTVDASAVCALRKELGEDGYRAAIAGPGLVIDGLDRAAFAAALRGGRLGDHLVAVGAALLETTTQPDDAFARARMRFAFSPACWRSRPRGLRVDATQLAARLAPAVAT